MILSLRAPAPPRMGNPLALPGRLLAALRQDRRVWSEDGLALVQVRGLDQPDAEHLRLRIREELEAIPGVDWAEAHGCTGRVGITFDPARISVGELVAAVEAIEADAGVAGEHLDNAVEHPADPQPLQRAATALVADVAGLGLGAFNRLARISPIPLEAASIVTLLQHQPNLRRMVERGFGVHATDLALAVTNAVAQGLAQGQASLIVDAIHRGAGISEVRSRQRVWAERAQELLAPSTDPRAAEDAKRLGAAGNRPSPLPKGPIERYATQATVGSTVASASALAFTRDPKRAANAFLAGLPRAAQLGREGFAGQFGRALAGRGMIPLDPTVLRRLDRIDTVMIEGALLQGAWGVGEAVAFGHGDETGICRQAETLLALPAVDEVRRSANAALGPVDALNMPLPRGGRTRLRELQRGGRQVMALAVKGRIKGLVALEQGDNPVAGMLLNNLRRSNLSVLVAGDAPRGLNGIDGTLPVGAGFAQGVRAAQEDGAAVAVVAADDVEALRAADCGIGLIREVRDEPNGAAAGPRVPWTADLLGDSLEDAAFVLEACGRARELSKRSVSLAMGGAGLGAFIAFLGPRSSAASRVSLAVNSTAALSLAVGHWSAASQVRRFAPLVLDPTPWHALPGETALRRLGSHLQGLTPEQAHARLDQAGGGEAEGWLGRTLRPFIDELANPLTPVLALGAGLSAAAGSATDALIVTGLIGLNALVGGAQRLRTEQEIEALLEAASTTVRVLRHGQQHEIAAGALVRGDIVVYEGGDVVVGDARIIEADNVEVDESSLTGESLPVTKGVDPCPTAAVPDRHCMLYDGTTVVTGRATAVVVATGTATEAGHSMAAAGIEPPPSGVEQRLAQLTTQTVPIAVGAGAALTAAGLLQRWPTNQIVGSAVSLAVASVPEGLPFVANVAQLAAARRLTGCNALVRNPRAVEALGRVDVLCFDKTGTLTKGKIKLRRISDGVRAHELGGELSGYLRDVLAVALRANPEYTGERLPNETDQAVAKGAEKAGLNGEDDWHRVAELPFEAARGFHAVLGEDDRGRRLHVKGAPEVVLPRCARWRRNGSIDELGRDQRAALEVEVEQLARTGARVLAVAERAASNRDDLDADRLHNLEFLGFLAFSEEVRSSAVEAVTDVQRAGVEVVMITGDHPSTAESIAAELGILDGKRVLTGAELDEIEDESLPAILEEVSVYARVTPAQKVRIVRGLQDAGRTVAMTGDGANDAASIRLAHCGVAVGKHSSPAAREAADIVVTTNRVETIVAAIVEGRAMWGSVRDALAILVGGNLGEIGFSVAGSLIGRGPALNARQLLLVNLLTDLAPAVAIALRPPRNTTAEVLLAEGPEASLGTRLDREIAARALTTAAGATGAYVAARLTGRAPRARTVALVALVGTQLGQTIQSAQGSRLVLATGVLSVAALAGIVQTPGLSHFFGCRPLGPVGWTTAATASALATGASGLSFRLLQHAALPGAGPDGEQALSRSAGLPGAGRVADEPPRRLDVLGARGQRADRQPQRVAAVKDGVGEIEGA